MHDELIGCRRFLVDQLQKEFVGPGSEGPDGEDPEYERISENPLQRYALGVLYPQRAIVGDDLALDDATENDLGNLEVPEAVQEPGDHNSGDTRMSSTPDDEEHLDATISGANQFCPSSYGITFFVSSEHSTVNVIVTAATYRRLKGDEASVLLDGDDIAFKDLESNENFHVQDGRLHYKSSKSMANFRTSMEKTDYLRLSRVHDKARNFSTRGYRRQPTTLFDGKVRLVPGFHSVTTTNSKNSDIRIRCRDDSPGQYKVTIAVLNKNHMGPGENKYSNPEMCFFQNQISVSVSGSARLFELPGIAISPTVEPADKLLYRRRLIFAAGHGCSVDWNHPTAPTVIQSTFTPCVMVPRVETFPKRIAALKLRIFDMQYLANSSDKLAILTEIRTFISDYDSWVTELSQEVLSIDSPLKHSAEKVIEDCQRVKDRLWNAVTILEEDETVWKAFQLTNLSMTMQRYHTDRFVKQPRTSRDPKPPFPTSYESLEGVSAKWRPFQLAFLLLSLEPAINDQSHLRGVADLIWFPTGGGKTEAYLGVIAFTIFYRRMRFGAQGAGVSAIMRYTLRLLTAQQFERASTLISACEFIRRSNARLDLGNDPISIGLWVGLDNTPNTQSKAASEVAAMVNPSNDEFEDKNPFQVMLCPWCGTRLYDTERPARSGYVSSPHFHFKCIEPTCAFFDVLPLQVVDEHLYTNPPSLLFATVDKFAKLAWDASTMSFFGLGTYHDGSVRYVRRPPDLIIQDELHLIAGPLGSIFGLYEVMIDYLCSGMGIKPRIVCSTATIKKASEQVRLLFDRETCVFPPPGTTIEDNYFSNEISLDEAPGRMYFGLMSVGVTRISAQVKALSNILSNNVKISEKHRDVYYSLVCYFNTIKELGHASSLFDADIREKLQTLQSRFRTVNFQGERPLWKKELTGRAFSKELPKVLKQLQDERLPSPNAIPAVLTTNMFSVGVDVSRLNLMAMIGQPKSTSEYIQSTSRVGRSDPGLVITILDGFCVRDRSHFENFKAYHESFYRFVEPSGSTPFTEAARRRVLRALTIIAARLLHSLSENSDADRFEKRMIPDDLTTFLTNRVGTIDKGELSDTLSEWYSHIESWAGRTGTKLHFRAPYQLFAKPKNVANYPVLMRQFGDVEQSVEAESWPILTAMRSVDSPCVCVVED